jgi:hypothetical protein
MRVVVLPLEMPGLRSRASARARARGAFDVAIPADVGAHNGLGERMHLKKNGLGDKRRTTGPTPRCSRRRLEEDPGAADRYLVA